MDDKNNILEEDNTKIKLKRCPNGTRRNKKTKKCEPINKDKTDIENKNISIDKNKLLEDNQILEDEEKKVKLKKCPNGTRRNKKTKKCEPTKKIKLNIIQKVGKEKTLETPIIKQTTVKKTESIPHSKKTIKLKLKRCPNGTRRNKITKKCEPKEIQKNKIKLKIVKKLKDKEEKKDEEIEEIKDGKIEEIKDGKEIEEIKDGEIEEIKDGEIEEIKDGEIEEIKDGEIEEIKDGEIEEIEDYEYLYPYLDDKDFNIKISSKKEFFNTQYEIPENKDIETESDKICNSDFQLAPHQQFVKNFLSLQTPYNSLLLYHGLGSGKTCSAISVAEDMRDYMIQSGMTNRIIVIASPNVQENFKLQLFNENKLKLINGVWNIKSCTGNKFLKEINPMNMTGLSKKKVISQIKKIINKYYLFLGYIEFSNYIEKKTKVPEQLNEDEEKKENYIKNIIRKMFNHRLVIIDEVHNIRLTDENKSKRKKVALELDKVVTYAQSMRLLLLSATPMFNSYKEIIWLTNMMNKNDNRSTIQISDVFTKEGQFKIDDNGVEIGKEILRRKLTGYISYVRGDDPYKFPFRIWPNEFENDTSKQLNVNEYPKYQLNGKEIIQGIEFLSLYMTKMNPLQERYYNLIINHAKQRLENQIKKDDAKNTTEFEDMDKFGYTILQQPIEALNMIYPLDEINIAEDITEPNKKDISKNIVDNISNLIGSDGLNRIMSYKSSMNPPYRTDFEYKTKKYGRIFSPSEIEKYSSKIKTICDNIIHSEGIVLIYSQYIDGGLVPLALALEELGFIRAGKNKSLFNKPPVPVIDAITYEPYDKTKKYDRFNPAKYVMITGNKQLSPDNVEDLKLVTDTNNKDGSQVKVVLISQAGSEGLDFNSIRQVHIMEPWYNMNRIEQIIGRAVRNCSHKRLEFEKRNVEIYLHGSILQETDKEAVDLYVYRLAERKSIQIGNVTRFLKRIAVDCILNQNQTKYSSEYMNINVKQILSSGKEINYKVGDKTYSAICDYMKTCDYTCKPNIELKDIKPHTYSYDKYYLTTNKEQIIQRIRDLMKERYFYTSNELIYHINAIKKYPLEHIYASINQLIDNKNEIIVDMYGRTGKLINIGDLYLYQPIELYNKNITLFDRRVPLDYKRNKMTIELENNGKIGEMDEIGKMSISKPKIVSKVKIKSDGPKPIEELYKKGKEILENIFELYETCIKEKSKSDEKTNTWYYFCFNALREMERLNPEWNINYMKKYIIYHLIEELLYKDKIELLKYIYNINITENKEELNNKEYIKYQIRNYFEKKELRYRNIIGIQISQGNENKLLIKEEKNSHIIWNNAEPEDISDFKEVISREMNNKFSPYKEKLNIYLGFMIIFKDEYMLFKTKELSKKRNKGSRCDQSTKDNIVSLLNILLKREEYNTKTKINKIELCILQEFIMRIFTENKKDNKIWFLIPEEAIEINIEKLLLD